MQHLLITCLDRQSSIDGSVKFLWQLPDGLTVESIRFSFRGQEYLCISSQVGCNIGCTFCETGKQRCLRNLTTTEISQQVTLVLEEERQRGGVQTLDQVAFAGMGEPLLNYAPVVEAATYLRREGWTQTVSVSTSGLAPQMKQLAQTAATAVNTLFLSLHATTDELRVQLVPVTKKYPLAIILDAARFFARQTGQKVIATYLLFADLNDSDADLERLMTLLNPEEFIIQLSEWNPVAQAQFVPSPRLDLFRETLARQGFEVFIQRSKGRDIEAGCGQLRSRRLHVLPRP